MALFRLTSSLKVVLAWGYAFGQTFIFSEEDVMGRAAISQDVSSYCALPEHRLE